MTRRGVAVAVAAVCVLAGCGSQEKGREDAYRTAVRAPIGSLSELSSQVSAACAGGAQPDRNACYAGTQSEIAATRTLQAAMRSVPTPERFRSADADLTRALDVFANGLIKRNQGLMNRSTADYDAGQTLIAQGLAAQQAALAEFPADSGIGG